MDGTALAAPSAADLVRRRAFWLGDALVTPATREIVGPGGRLSVEPRVMQVLLALADAAGEVVTRDQLLRLCWNSRFVGDDALNRAIAEVRRVARVLQAAGLTVETIPRTGYRLVGPPPRDAGLEPPASAAPAAGRRWLLAVGAGAALIAAGGVADWALRRDEDDRRAKHLTVEATLAMAADTEADYRRALELLGQASRLAPQDPAVWGKLALAWRSMTELAGPAQMAGAVEGCRQAATRALQLDPRQPDARTALAILRPTYGDWLITERKLGAVLADAPDNGDAIDALSMLRFSVGRCREAAALSGGVENREPLSPIRLYRRTYRQWTIGNLPEADRTIERALQLWPKHPGVWFARLWLMAFTDRAEVALAQLEDVEARPEFPDAYASLLRTSMTALATRAPAIVEQAVAMNMAEAKRGPGGAIYGTMVLNGLGRLDEAFDVAGGYLLRHGDVIGALRRPRTQPLVNDQRHRKTLMLFVPASAPMRADRRFADLCRGCGLADYWRQSGRGPDFLGGHPLEGG